MLMVACSVVTTILVKDHKQKVFLTNLIKSAMPGAKLPPPTTGDT